MSATHAVDQAADLAKYGCAGYIGAWASSPTMALSKFLAQPPIDRAIISPSAASPKLSEPEYTNFLRTGVSEEVSANLMATLMIGLST